jgi:hypothetical protein
MQSRAAAFSGVRKKALELLRSLSHSSAIESIGLQEEVPGWAFTL